MTDLLLILDIQKGMKVKCLEMYKGETDDLDFIQSDKQWSGMLVLRYRREGIEYHLRRNLKKVGKRH